MTNSIVEVEDTINLGLDYIFSMQAEDGSWNEWNLPPGSSSVWTTAYVGYKLLPFTYRPEMIIAGRILKAALWLNDNSFADYGWGFNEIVGPDADSTAYAILFLASAGFPVPDKHYQILVKWQNSDGGFSTYPPNHEPGSWNVSHPDVTPVVLLSLLTNPVLTHDAIQPGIDYVLSQRTSPGMWNSFWWDSCLYGTEASLSLLNALGINLPLNSAISRTEPSNAFEAALLISCLLYLDSKWFNLRIKHLVNELIGQQQSNGSWNTAPVLRITRRDCFEPWKSVDAGPLFSEVNNLFTTSTVLHSLMKVRPLLSEI